MAAHGDKMSDHLQKYGAVILCGGRSRRMGVDKSVALLDHQGRWLLATLAEYLATRFGHVILATNNLAKLENRSELHPYHVVTDLFPGAGPAGAICSALKARPDIKALFCMACDMPNIYWPLIDKMAQVLEREEAETVVPRHPKIWGGPEDPPKCEPLYAFYSQATCFEFEKGLDKGQHKLQIFLSQMKTVYLDLDPEDLSSAFFSNLNTLDDVERAGLPMEGLNYLRSDC